MDFDRFTLRANVGRADVLSDAAAREYGIEPEAGLILLNLVVLENGDNAQSTPVEAQVRVQQESLSGHTSSVDMRAVESNGHVSYIGTMEASGERVLQLLIEALPEGADQPMRMNFEVRLEAFESGDYQ